MEGVFLPRPITELVILGLGQSSQSWPGFISERPDFAGEVWTVNAGVLAFRHDVVFDMHTEEYVFSQDDFRVEQILSRRKWLETHDRTVVLPKALAKYPTSQTYPLKLVAEALQSDYFACGMAYMLAMAHLCGVRRLHLFGCDYISEKANRDGTVKMEDGRANVEYWLGRLSERGCQVWVTEKSPVLGADKRINGALYGYHTPAQTALAPNGKYLFMDPDYV
jgi:hypothetical protein